MFLGVRSYNDSASCHDYESARRTLERTSLTPKTKRPRVEKLWGYHLGMSRNHGVTWVREMQDKGYEGAIAFRLHDTDVVIWRPDNSFELENWGSVTTSGFARTFLPGGVNLAHPVTRRGGTGGYVGTHYRVEGEWWVCCGATPRFRQHGDDWLPDEDTVDKVAFPELTSRAAARDLAAELHLRDFETWLSTAPHFTEIEHEGWDVEDCMDALRERDFMQASKHLPLTHDTGAYGTKLKIIPIITGERDMHVTTSALGKLKLAAWEQCGLLRKEIFRTLPMTEFNRRMQRVKALARLDHTTTWHYGPRR